MRKFREGARVKVIASTYHAEGRHFAPSQNMVGKICEVLRPTFSAYQVWAPDKSDWFNFNESDLKLDQGTFEPLTIDGDEIEYKTNCQVVAYGGWVNAMHVVTLANFDRAFPVLAILESKKGVLDGFTEMRPLPTKRPWTDDELMRGNLDGYYKVVDDGVTLLRSINLIRDGRVYINSERHCSKDFFIKNAVHVDRGGNETELYKEVAQ